MPKGAEPKLEGVVGILRNGDDIVELSLLQYAMDGNLQYLDAAIKELLKEKREPEETEKKKDIVEAIEEIVRLIQNIRSYARIIRAKPRKVSFRDVLFPLVQKAEGLAILASRVGMFRRARGTLLASNRLVYDHQRGLQMNENAAKALYGMGAILLHELQRPYEALKILILALEVCMKNGYRDGEARTLNDIGNALLALGRAKEALDQHKESLRISIEIGDRRGEAAALGNTGNDLLNVSRWVDAMDYYVRALDIDKEIGDREGEANAYNNIGNALRFLGRRNEALCQHKESLKISVEIGDRYREALALGNIGTDLFDMSRWVEAMNYYMQALDIEKQIGNRIGEANAHNSIGNVHRSLGRLTGTLREHNEALRISRQIKDSLGEVTALGNIGNDLFLMGKPSEAIEYYKHLLKVNLEIGNKRGQAIATTNIGICLGEARKWNEAIHQFEQALKIDRELGDKEGASADLSNIGLTLLNLGRLNEAVVHYKQALEIDQEIGDREGEAKDLANIGKALENSPDLDEAMKYHEKARDISRQIGHVYGEAANIKALGDCSLARGDFDSALKHFTESIELFENQRNSIPSPELRVEFRTQYTESYDAIAYALYEKYLGSVPLSIQGIAEDREDWKDAKQCLNYIELSKSSVVAEALESALAQYKEDTTRHVTPLSAMSKEFVDKLRKVRRIQSEIEEEKSKLKSKAIDMESFEQQKKKLDEEFYSAQRDLMKAKLELYSAGGELGVVLPPKDYDTVGEFLKTMTRGEYNSWGVLEFIVLPKWKTLLVFLLFKERVAKKGQVEGEASHDDVKWVWDARNGVDIEKLVENCNKGVQTMDLIRKSSLLLYERKFDECMKKLDEADSLLNGLASTLSSELIFGKIKEVLQNKPFEHLIIVPHRWLHYVPFETLKAEESALPLGVTYSVSRTFSLRLVRIAIEERDKQTHEYVCNDSGALKSIDLGTLRALAFGNLEGSEEQIEAIMETLTKLIGKSRGGMIQAPLVRIYGSDATKSNFRDYANSTWPWLFVHYSGHAEFTGGEPMMSHLELHDGEFSAYEIWSEVAFKGCPMVYLSACETGFSDLREGDEAFGLIRALMLSGSTTIIASYWPVIATCARLYAERFYESHLLEGKSAAEALRAARESAYDEFPSKPSLWASFTIYGDPFRQLSYFTRSKSY